MDLDNNNRNTKTYKGQIGVINDRNIMWYGVYYNNSVVENRQFT